jgi:hypothetical protein
LFTLLVGWYASAVSLPLGDVILAQLVCPLNIIIFCLHQKLLTYLSTNIEGSTGKVNEIKFLPKNVEEIVMVSLKMAKIMFVGAIMVKFSKLACKQDIV